MTQVQAALTIALIALATLFTRAAPFVLFSTKAKTPPFVNFLGRVLPHAMMGMLVVYCLKNISFAQAPYGLPELVCVGLVVLLHVWKRNLMLSIVSGTVLYMLLVQGVIW